MKDTARQAFFHLTVAFEGGYIRHMFPDVKRLISGGFGLLLDPLELAIHLPWKRPDGLRATHSEIAAEWSRLRNFIDANPGCEWWSWRRFADKTTIRLDDDALFHAFTAKTSHNEGILREGFPDYDTWCADAQLAVHSQAWAVGPGFFKPSAGPRYFPKLTKALGARDWVTASVECKMPEGDTTNRGVAPRNEANRTLWLNAAAIEQGGLNPEALYYPKDLTRPEIDHEAPTLPEGLPPSPDSEPPSVIVTQPIVHSLHIAGLPGVEDDEPNSAA